MSQTYGTILFFAVFFLLGGVAISVISNDRRARRRRERRRERKKHDDADYHCKYWWGDRQESVGAWCLICNPTRKDALHRGQQDAL